MNPALRTFPAVALLTGAALSVAPVVRADDGGLAGTRAGEGRPHPGRTASPAASPPGDAPSAGTHEEGGRRWRLVPEWTPSSLPVPEARERDTAQDLPQSERLYDSRRTASEPSGRAMRVLPLGTGLALTGLGLGLAFLGLRLRRR